MLTGRAGAAEGKARRAGAPRRRRTPPGREAGSGSACRSNNNQLQNSLYGKPT